MSNSVSANMWMDRSGRGGHATISGSGFTVFSDNSDPYHECI